MPALHSFCPCQQRPLQRGVAAIEFALIASLMIVMLLGMFIWWNYFQTSQILNRAAGDGARLAHSLVLSKTDPCMAGSAAEHQTLIQNQVTTVMRAQLKHAGLAESRLTLSDFQWICSAQGAESFRFNVQYQMPALLSNNAWVAEPSSIHIQDKIVVHFPSQS